MRKKGVRFLSLLLLAAVGCGASPTTSALTLPGAHDDAGGAARRGDGGGGVLEAAAAADVGGEQLVPPAPDATSPARDAAVEGPPVLVVEIAGCSSAGNELEARYPNNNAEPCAGTDCAHLICTDDYDFGGKLTQIVSDCPVQRGGCASSGVCVAACP